MDLMLEYFKISAEVAKSLFAQWEKIEDVASDFIQMVEKISLALIEKMK